MIQVFHKIILPSVHLRPYVRDIMFLDFSADAGDAIPVKPFPANTEHCLVFYLHGFVTATVPGQGAASIYPKVAVNGSQLSRFDFHISPRFQILSVQFQPGILSKFLRLPLTGLTDLRIDGESILTPEVGRLHDRLANAASYEEIIAEVEAYLWHRIGSRKMDIHPIDSVARMLTDHPAGASMERLAADACLSLSQFERRFVQLQGITPKLYARINRFYKAYRLKEQHPDWDWLSIALQTGYHDYQHLVKDFRQFAADTPHSLLLAQVQSPDGLVRHRKDC